MVCNYTTATASLFWPQVKSKHKMARSIQEAERLRTDLSVIKSSSHPKAVTKTRKNPPCQTRSPVKCADVVRAIFPVFHALTGLAEKVFARSCD